MTALKNNEWFKEQCVYQIYPSSFCDSEGHGVGTLRGITSKLDYLKELGVDVVWLSPVFKSPMKDMGYDISDYRDIREEFGSLKDWDDLKDGLHNRGMKIMMDLVVNHSSDQHEWFKESRSSKTNEKRDWYIWRPARQGPNGERLPPNNWESVFGGESAWAWDHKTEEYYLRLFVKEQPDLNWENQKLREAVYDAMRFWLDRGCDGFRMDVINLISKTPGLPDATNVRDGELQPCFEHCVNGPRVHEFLKEMNQAVLSKYDTITVGEAPWTRDINTLLEYSRPENKELQMLFAFELHELTGSNDGNEEDTMKWRTYRLQEFKEVIEKYQTGLWGKGWNSLFLANHDQPRAISHFANDSSEFRAASAKLLATLHNTLCGTVFIYQGDEIGMKNAPSSWTIDDFPDVATQMYWKTMLTKRQQETGLQDPDMSDVFGNVLRKARDNGRTPLPWNSEPHGGFTRGPKPWMRVNEDFAEGWNVKDQQKDPASVLEYWKKIVALRKKHPILVHGSFTLLDRANPTIFAYMREWEGETAFVMLSFAQGEVMYDLPFEAGDLGKAKLLIWTGEVDGQHSHGEGGAPPPLKMGSMVKLSAFEGRVYLM
ncbi:glycoside hydrolase family 13 protein [Meredithblackwellia eburnea MCA 4105]